MPQIDLWTYHSIFCTIAIYFFFVASFTITFFLPTLYTTMKLRFEAITYIIEEKKKMPYKFFVTKKYSLYFIKFLKRLN